MRFYDRAEGTIGFDWVLNCAAVNVGAGDVTIQGIAPNDRRSLYSLGTNRL